MKKKSIEASELPHVLPLGGRPSFWHFVLPFGRTFTNAFLVFVLPKLPIFAICPPFPPLTIAFLAICPPKFAHFCHLSSRFKKCPPAVLLFHHLSFQIRDDILPSHFWNVAALITGLEFASTELEIADTRWCQFWTILKPDWSVDI